MSRKKSNIRNFFLPAEKVAVAADVEAAQTAKRSRIGSPGGAVASTSGDGAEASTSIVEVESDDDDDSFSSQASTQSSQSTDASSSQASPGGSGAKKAKIDELFKVDSIEQIAERTEVWTAKKESKKRANPNNEWLQEYPWAFFVYKEVEGGRKVVAGILCKWCRETAARRPKTEVQLLFSRSKTAFVNSAYTNWEQAASKMFHHEFGDSDTNKNAPWQGKHHGAVEKRKLREKMLSSAYQTTHMRWRSDSLKRAEVEKSGKDVRSAVIVAGAHAAEDNRKAISVFIRLLLKLIQQKVPPVKRFPREIRFLNLVNVEIIKRLQNRYTSVNAVSDFTAALHWAVLYGLYVDMVSTCEVDEEISFAVLVDLASTSKTREWVAVCVRYVSSANDGEVCERLLKISRASGKSGVAIMKAISESLEWFNDQMEELAKTCTFLFPDNGPKKLSLVNCTAYGSDGGGGARSKFRSANCRIRAYNPRITDWWCGSHRVQLASKRASRQNKFLNDHYDATIHLQKLLTMSAEVDKIFKRSQSAVYGIPSGAETSFSDVPMFKWESENDCLAKEAKLHKAIAATIIDIRENCKDANSRRFTSHYLANLVVKPMRILYVALKRDLLGIAVQLIRKTEVTGIELTEFETAVSRAMFGFEKLVVRDGQLYSKAKEDLRMGIYAEFQHDTDESLDDLFHKADEQRGTAASAFIEHIASYMVKEKRLLFKGYEVLSMDQLGVSVDCKEDLSEYGIEQEEALAKWFCSPVRFVAEWPELRGAVFEAAALGTPVELHDQLEDLKFQMFNLLRLPENKKTTRNVLLRLLRSNAPCVRGKVLIRRIIKSYLELPLSTASVECVFSAVKLTDTRLCLRRKDETINQYITIVMESEPFETFNVDLAATIWDKNRNRRLALGKASTESRDENQLLRSMTAKAAGRLKKFECRMRLAKRSLQPESNPVDANDDSDDDDVVVDESIR